MHSQQESMMVVRADLCERLESLRRSAARGTLHDLVARIESITSLAAAYGLTPVVRVSEALRQSIGENGRGRSSLYLARLQDAIGCERMDEEASESMLASVSVRFCA